MEEILCIDVHRLPFETIYENDIFKTIDDECWYLCFPKTPLRNPDFRCLTVAQLHSLMSVSRRI